MKTRFGFAATSLLAVAFVMFAGSQAFCGVISVNMDSWSEAEGFDHQDNPMLLTEVAGLVPAPNWNAYGAGSFHGVTPVDDSGAVTTLAITGTGGNNSWNTGGTGTKHMFADFCSDNGATLDISGVPYANYDLIVYSKSWEARDMNFSVNGGDVQTINSGGESPGSFGDDGELVEGVHYTTFSGLSGAITLTHDHLSGIQIVEAAAVPEPTTAVLLGLASVLGLSIFTRRRR